MNNEGFKNNKFPTISLFVETCHTNQLQYCKYSLSDKDKVGRTQGPNGAEDTVYKSLKRLYLDMEDFTEYDFAQTYLDGYVHWERLCTCKWFEPHLAQWRKELHLKVKARELKKLMVVAREDSKEGNSAAKFLITRGYADKAEKGRPSKEAILEEAERLALLEKTFEEDLKRIQHNLSS